MRICRLYCNLKRYGGTTPVELTNALDFSRKSKDLSHLTTKLFKNELSTQEKECALCDIISHYKKQKS